MKVGFIGLGNVGAKLAGTVLRNGVDLIVHDLDEIRMDGFVALGAQRADSPAELASACHIVVTRLPSPAACSTVMEAADGVVAGLGSGKIWAEMSTTDAAEVRRIAALVEVRGASAIECPVSGGCHRAATGNISIFAGGDRRTFDRILPLLTMLGRRVLHTGPLGSASVLKVMTNYLATANLLSLCEALITMKAVGIDMATAYRAITVSSGTSFVHETEGQVILNGSRDISFTMDLVLKDVGLFQALADRHRVSLQIGLLLIDIFCDGQRRYGDRAKSDDIVRWLEDATGLAVRADGFPAELLDIEPEATGHEVRATSSFPTDGRS